MYNIYQYIYTQDIIGIESSWFYINNERQTQQDRNKRTNDTKGDDAYQGFNINNLKISFFLLIHFSFKP